MMPSTQVTFYIAFVAGLVSFLSPCVLPLVPGYISMVSGLSVEELTRTGSSAIRRTWASSLLFVVGFSLVFSVLGAFATGLVSPLSAYLPVLRKIAGVVVILFGLHMMRLVPLRFLYYQKSLTVTKARSGYVGPVLLGMAFAFGWTPCVGPILASLLALAATEGGVTHGMALLFAYSLGIGVPFLLTGFAVSRFLGLLRRYGRFVRTVEIGSGVLLVVVGVLIFTNGLASVTDLFPFLNGFVL